MAQILPLHYIVYKVIKSQMTFQRLTCHYKHRLVAKFDEVLMVIQYIVLDYFDRKSDGCSSRHVSYLEFPDQDHRCSFGLRRYYYSY